MSKPKFTPDPPPVTPSRVEAEWLWRQFQRIEDWWPKSYDNRLALLELLQPYKPGTWPIVDSSYTNFSTANAEQVFETTLLIYNEDTSFEESIGGYENFDGVTRTKVDIAIDVQAVSDEGHAVAFQSGGGTVVRTDGKVWQYVTPSGPFPTGLVWFNDRYILVSAVSGVGGIVVEESEDGINWSTLLDTSSSDYQPSSLATDGTTLATCQSPSDSRLIDGVWTSSNGSDWAFTDLDATFGDEPLTRIFYSNNKWFISTLKERLYVSNNATGPYTLALSLGGLANYFEQVVYGLDRWMAVSNGTGGVAYWSTDAVTWNSGRSVSTSGGGVPLQYYDGLGWIYSRGTVCQYSVSGNNNDWVDCNNTLSDLRGSMWINRTPRT